ncbi:hypothetical protein B0H67DRAFT_92116 [Lasiosphaeris hirsuta]|uniref:Uncharacterized protein n=1 Tax=Lasiosphaeris hirsuta TaxID=260670 RepID=A0AA40BCY6_9PEZI|nr:hypothetical protein B0H67DRAFT_92116 [Lasiosphaeris hirsuta]
MDSLMSSSGALPLVCWRRLMGERGTGRGWVPNGAAQSTETRDLSFASLARDFPNSVITHAAGLYSHLSTLPFSWESRTRPIMNISHGPGYRNRIKFFGAGKYLLKAKETSPGGNLRAMPHIASIDDRVNVAAGAWERWKLPGDGQVCSTPQNRLLVNRCRGFHFRWRCSSATMDVRPVGAVPTSSVTTSFSCNRGRGSSLHVPRSPQFNNVDASFVNCPK